MTTMHSPDNEGAGPSRASDTASPADRESALEMATAWLEAEPAPGDPRPWREAAGDGVRGGAWTFFLDVLFSGRPRAASLVRHLAKTELPPAEWIPTLGRFLRQVPVHRAWSDWREEGDREELRIRLEALGELDALTEPLADFVLFFFRASDPTMYQAAAVAAGRHAGRDPRVDRYVEEYATSRGVDLSGPVSFNGTRSRRRLFLFLVGHATRRAEGPPPGATADGLRLAAEPLVPWSAEGAPLESPADLSVYLNGLELLCRDPHLGGRAKSLAVDLLPRVAADPHATEDRAVAHRWARLAATVVEGGESTGREVTHSWLGWLQEELDGYGNGREGVGRRVARLVRLDELLKAPSYVPSSGVDRWIRGLDEGLQGQALRWGRARAKTWLQRAGMDPDVASAEFQPGDGLIHELLSLSERAGAGGSKEGGRGFAEASGGSAQRLLVRRLLGLLETSSNWFALSEGERGLAAFLLLDEFLHPALPLHELRAMVLGGSRRGSGESWPPERPAAGDGAHGGEGVGPLVGWLVSRLKEWEGQPTDSLVDARFLHQCDDEDLLLRVLPSRRRSELLPALADAFEHRLRLNLARDLDFDVRAYLLRVAIRRPHPSFFALLHAIVADRSHVGFGGEAVPVAEWVQELGDAARIHYEGEGGSGEMPEAPSGAVSGFPLLSALRERLSRCRETEALPELLALLGGVLDGSSDGEGAAAADVAVLVSWVNEGRSTPVRGGSGAWGEMGSLDLREELLKAAGALNEAREALRPATLAELDGARVAIQGARARVRRLGRWVPQLLPPREGDLAGAVLDRVERELEVWVARLSELEEEWFLQGEAKGGGESRWDRLLRRASEVEGSHLRRAVLGLLWGELSREIRGDVQEGAEQRSHEAWRREEALLRWAVQRAPELLPAADRGAWLEWVADRWGTMAEDAMEAGFESRLVRLVRGKEGGILALRPETEGLLERLRLWFFNAYRIGDAMRLTRILNARRGRGFVGSLPRELASFFFHFSTLWLALLVGAVLMLDFGDAWTAMAEVGDVRGIAITFGIGVLGALGYMASDLRSRVRTAPEESPWKAALSRFGRVSVLLVACLAYTLTLTGFLWLLLSGTDEVVHGEGALLHVVVWSGFALFIGVFFGLLARRT